MATITEREALQIDAANKSGRVPVVLIHGLWLLAGSWDPWATMFEEAGYAALTPSWPDDPETLEAARANPQAFAGKTVGQVTEHMSEVLSQLSGKPAVIGHSFGGLIAQLIADRDLSAVTVAIDPAPFRGILPLPPAALRSVLPVLRNPANRARAVTLTFDQFRYAWANAVGEEEARRLHDSFHVAAPGAPIFQAAVANLNPSSQLKLDTRNPRRGPLLITSGEADHAVPPAFATAAFKKQRRNEGVTEFKEFSNRGHTLTIDDGWREVAEAALAFVQRFA
jgi:pimeloyl-ACP methyl ester carboxylesterase